MSSESVRFPIVAIGASAGGIPAMEGFFKGLPPDTGMGFVIITHLNPERESLLHEVVRRYTKMPVVVADDAMKIEPERVYVMPENAILTVDKGALKIRRPNTLTRERKPVDIFFSSLADDQGEYAVGVILSGGDGDGTLGAKMIKERGGLTMAQLSDESGPRNPEMPQSAISSGLVDIATPAEEMGGKLVAFMRSFEVLHGLTQSKGLDEDAAFNARPEIYAILHAHSGHDFSGYKTKTFVRRVRRRMQLAQITSVDAYVERLKGDATEVMNLFRDLLINVTNFFRDADAFKMLEDTVIPRLFETKNASDTIRVWVPGCATGEEVFSLAILMREHLDKLSAPPRVQIFATDIDEPALAVARTARYPEELLEGVSSERRRRFFNGDASLVLAAEVRELCIFSSHSVIRDPPFSRMDLVSCRNLLIYFGPDIQNRVIPTFHYALKPGGYLFLGTSEGVSQHTELFATLDKKHRIFQARELASPMPRLPIVLGERHTHPHSLFFGSGGDGRKPGAYPLRQAVEAQVLDRFAPPHVVVNGDGDIVYYSARTGRYLEASQGAPSRQLLTMARRGLRLDLRAALRDALSTRSRIVRENIAVDDDDGDEDGDSHYINLTIEPISNQAPGEALYLILFTASGRVEARARAANEAREHDGVADLERELRDTRERLQSTIEEYETALEEVKSTNEELVSVNEEAQSSNEELEASKEEMQSLNEELNTINSELNSKIEELDRANNDLKNFFESTQIATIFLDSELVIRSFTPAASEFFNLRPADIGRPLGELSNQLDYPEMNEHLRNVFATGETVDHRLARDRRGRRHLVRLIPYRGDSNKIRGVVMTLIDVTPLAEAEDHQKVLISELNHRVKNMLAVAISISNQTMKNTASKEAYHEALTGRLRAMGRAYSTLSRENWTEASIQQLLEQEINPFGAERFRTAGAEIGLKPWQALALGMVFHELATNAAKYGALSDRSGKVDVSWRTLDGALEVEWREHDGPPVKQPQHSGFGLSLLKGEIGYRLGGKVETNFHSDGLEVRLSFPLERK